MFEEFSAFLLEVSGLAEEEESQVKWSTMDLGIRGLAFVAHDLVLTAFV